MANKTQLDSRPNQISKDVQGPDVPIPLSPQWLLPKSGEKSKVVPGESHFGPHQGSANRSDILKSPGNAEEVLDNHKKDVFRPSVLDMESGRRDRWRDEERDTNSSVRRDRWRDGDKELGDNRKVDRWTESSGRPYGEARRAPPERWTDSGNKEITQDQRRDNKWNNRWGPDDKESYSVGREKWANSTKDADMFLDKGPSNLAYDGKDERDGDHYRPWRPSNRGRGEPPHNQALTPNRPIPSFVHGRGRGESPGNSFSLGRGNFGPGGSSMNDISPHLQRFGSFSEKVEDAHGDPSLLRYNRTKLLDIYRMTDMKSCEKYLDGAVQVPSLTEEEPVQPLALYGPTPEELVILKGIDKGDIVSSGAPQITKDGPTSRSSTDFMHSRRSNSGSREDSPLTFDDSKDGTMDDAKDNYLNYSERFSYEKQTHPYSSPNTRVEAMSRTSSDNKFHSEASGEDSRSYRKNDDAPLSREPMLQGNTSIPHGGMWRSPSIERANSASRDLRERSADMGSRTSEVSWRQTQKDLNNEWENSLADSSYTKREGLKWQTGSDPILKRQNSSVLDKESETQKLSQPSPEDLVLYYKDPQGKIQGPFSGTDIIGWFEAGYLGIDLPVRLASAPPNSSFSVLGDVMPHLRAKAGPPPGFGAPKAELTDASGGSNFSTFGKLHVGSSDINMVNNEPRYVHGSAKEAENRYLESLMAGNKGGPLSEGLAGMQGYRGNNSSALPPFGAESGDNSYLYAQKLALERQRSLSNPYSYWPGRDVPPVASKPEIMQDSTMQHPNILSSIADNALLQQSRSQNIDLMSMIQGVLDRSNTGVNNGVSGWSNFPLQGGLGSLQDKLDMHQGQNFPLQAAFGMQQQRPQPQNPPSFTNLFPQAVDNPASMLTPEKLLSSGLSQDPQLLSLLQLQSPTPVTSQPMSLLDLLLLKQQQQKQEEQQQLLRQQRQLLSQVLSDAQQRLAEPPYGQLHSAGLSSGNASLGHPQFHPSPEMFQIGSQTQVPILQDERISNFAVPSSVSRDASHIVGSETSSIPLPHQMSGNAMHPRSWTASLQEQFGSMQQRGSLVTTTTMDTLPQLERPNISPLGQTLQSSESFEVAISEAAPSVPPEVILDQSSQVSCENELMIPEQVNNVVTTPVGVLEKLQVEGEQLNHESSVVNEAKNAETREVKKSEKKSKKSKASKTQSSDTAKRAAKTQLSKSSEIEVTNSNNVKPEMQNVSGESKNTVTADTMVTQVLPGHLPVQDGESVAQLSSGLRAWKPAPGFKPKSLLEIQQEEQRRAQTETAATEISTSLSSMSVSTPWSGVVANSDNKSFREIQQDTGSIESLMTKPDSSLNNKSKKSQTRNLSAENIVAKSIEREVVISDSVSSKPSASVVNSQNDSVDDDNFIEAKDTKKNRKKSAKAKTAGSKVSAPAASADVSVGASPIVKGKNSRQVQQEKEVLPAAPSGPSLGDFVVWKGESANASPAPAWSSDSGNLSKPTSLRDILKEQERKIPSEKKQTVQTPQKSVPNQPTKGGSSSWSVSASPPAKAAVPIHISSQTALHSKNSVDDDLFWGPIGHSKQEAKPSDFPQLGSKDTPSKGISGGSVSKQKSSPAPSQSTKKGKKGALTKQSEAMDFREWCESECVRLIGTKDTSFLEFCSKQSRSEAETLLIENLGSFDPDHKFIEKFLNYKDFLSVDVLEMAFQTENNLKVTGSVANDMTSAVGFGGSNSSKATAPDGTNKGDGKKKGKKGKKVSPLVLGFNVVSNRIMMGEIQTVED